MKTERKNVIWFIMCEMTIMLSIVQLIGIFEVENAFFNMVYYVFIQPQKLLFNNMLYFLSLIYINQKNDLDVHTVLRNFDGMKILFRLQRRGCNLLLRYLSLFVLPVMTIIILTSSFQILHLLKLFLVLGFLAAVWYEIYCYIYIITEKHFWGIVFLLISQFLLLIVVVVVASTLEQRLSGFLYKIIFYLPVIFILIALEKQCLQRKEWLK